MCNVRLAFTLLRRTDAGGNGWNGRISLCMGTERFSLEPCRCVDPISWSILWSNSCPVTRDVCSGVIDGLRVRIFPRRVFAGTAWTPFHSALVKHLPCRKVRGQRSFAQPSQLLGEATEKGNKKAMHSRHRVIASSFAGSPRSASIALRLE